MRTILAPAGRHRVAATVSAALGARLRAAAGRFADHWLPRACALCDCRLLRDEPGVCARCDAELPGRATLRCGGCAMPRPGDSGRCPACLASPPPWDQAIVLADYAPPLDRLIVALKFGGELSAARPLGVLLAAAVVRQGLHPPELLVPVPLAPRRLVARGYNQAEAIAAVAARRLALPHAPRLLQRLRDTPAQSGLPLAARRANLEGAMRAHPGAAGRCVAVVDDVMTTGATARAAALALKAAGARFVVNLAVARTP